MVMHWLQDEDGITTLDQLQLDIVGFLAILGEGSVLANAQVSTLSKWVFLPRLIPAPQSLMRPTRPTKLEPAPGTVTGIFSGNVAGSINHIGNIVCDADNLERYSVRVVSIRRVNNNQLKSKTIAPLTGVLFLGFFMSLILLALSIWREDGMSIVATILLSLLSSLIGYGNKWKLILPQRRVKSGKVPNGDVVIRYPKGSFLVVRCDEDVARELYFAPEAVNYKLEHGPSYRILSLVGTMMLMGGVICLANSQIQCQIAWAGCYMLLGASYWIVAALPAKVHWDTSAFQVENECTTDSTLDEKGFPSHHDTFTQALWKTIVLAKGTDWVSKSNSCPDTLAWRLWLNEARDEARKVGRAEVQMVDRRGKEIVTWQVPEWNPQTALGMLLAEQAKKDEKSVKEGIEEV
ncbi:hypothetical protein M011DRAFT_478544 [Sporormia fimetaria CBS 119925]|uniref:Uncharacterized protein n=1 Tax=Sporormia fimetaria CBS 119925 TaxID=1340428 RepID=A0A6A6V8W1_9PLEO|nr:hypothetical protein M011DRAFT_478544 [Sporormia fimetaria CBS 119925]